VKKGRTARGERASRAKLTEDDVHEIRAMLDSGENLTDIANEFGVHSTAIKAIKKGRSWGWLDV